MSDRFYEPGRDGRWQDMLQPRTYKQAVERIVVLEMALAFYSNAASYDPESQDAGIPSYDELMCDAGRQARIGRLAADCAEFMDWLTSLIAKDRKATCANGPDCEWPHD